ncbi:sialidase family protein [Deinococcus multiflagellatus]|uniref:Exo-alpha-sialidase n=1 Tax=Deinococcus multiflagellatus TaxID=1656887 RepID=A0ABW1ZSA3_9DEIO|nr:hypothetical protein [Deinococcus multiflagellatus]MBZ9715458.1 hypothetical protein [Deinococcus multiflagellatus]
MLAVPLLLAACQRGAQSEPLSGDFHALRVVGGTLLYGEHAGVRASQNGGRTWSEPDGSGDAMALVQAGDAVILAGHEVLQTSRNLGQSWTPLPLGTLPGGDLHGFAVDPARPEVWYANVMGRGVYRTTDGQNWSFLSAETTGAWALAAGPQPALYALDSGGLLVSPDGVTWTRRPSRGALHLDVHPVTGAVYVAGPQGVARSTDQGRTWKDLSFPGAARLVAVDPASDHRLYAVSESGVVSRSGDGGATWND